MLPPIVLDDLFEYNPVYFMYRAEFQLARASSTVEIQTIGGKTGQYVKLMTTSY